MANIVVMQRKSLLMKLRISYLLSLFVLIFGSCISPPNYPIEPEITFMSISRTEVDQNDTIRIKIEYTDGDGDLGYATQDTFCKQCNLDTCLGGGRSLFLIDERVPQCFAAVYQIPIIPPKGSSDAISGSIDFTGPPICCINTGFPCLLDSVKILDTVNLSVFLRDRAGNFSDTLALPPIIVHCNKLVQ